MSFESIYLEDIAAPIRNAIVGGPFGSNLVSKDYTSVGIPVIRGQNMGTRWVSGDFVYVSVEKAASLNQNKTRPGDLVFTQRGTLGQVSMVPDGPYPEYVVSQSQMKLTPDPEKADVAFLYYVFKSSEQLQHIQNTAIQTGVPHTNLGLLRRTPLQVPPLIEQKKIAAVLGSLDARIELLGTTNTTLEAIAQALFKSWFVDFDPVRAKMEGRPPTGLNAAAAALFPEQMQPSPVGPIPKGWTLTRVDAVADVIKGKSYSSSDLVKNSSTALVTLKSFARGGGFRMDGFKPYKGGFKPNQVLAPGELIVAYTDVTQAGEVIGNPAIVIGVDEYSTLVASLDVGIIRPHTPECGKPFLYGLFGTDAFRSHVRSYTSGTTVLHLGKEGVGSYLFARPPSKIAALFEEVAASLLARRQANFDQSRLLAAARDTLLPRLISGKLRLPDLDSVSHNLQS